MPFTVRILTVKKAEVVFENKEQAEKARKHTQ